MNSRKELERKILKLSHSNDQFKEKNTLLSARLKSVSQERNYYKSRVKHLTKSRDSWKRKHKGKQQKIKYLKSRVVPSSRIKGHPYPAFVMSLCIFLRIKGGCSYRGVVRILRVLCFCGFLHLSRIPCANSIQNWVSKVGLYCLTVVSKDLKGKKVSLIIDESIRLGQEKQLLILGIPWQKQGNVALRFEDVEVLHIEGATSWTGQEIAQRIEDLVAKEGFILKNLLSDEDTKLKKAARLSQVVHLPDIAHAVATALRKTFEQHPDYKHFTTLVATYQSQGVNQALSYLTPPRQRAKVRFMNQSRLVQWANRMLYRLEGLEEKAQQFFAKLPLHQPIIEQLTQSLDVAKAISLSFKTAGLSHKTIKNAQNILDKQPQDQECLATFVGHMQGYLNQYKQIMAQTAGFAIHASSEIIESFFGKYKQKVHQYPLTGVTKLNLELPLYTMTYKQLNRKISYALEDISILQVEQWIQKHTTESQLVKRTKFFKNNI